MLKYVGACRTKSIIGRYKVVGNLFGLSLNVSMVIKCGQSDQYRERSSIVVARNGNNYISSKHDGKVYSAMGGLEYTSHELVYLRPNWVTN